MVQNTLPNTQSTVQPTAAPGSAQAAMQNLNPTRILARRGRDIMLIGALVLLGGLVAGAVTLLLVLVASSVIVTIFTVLTAILVIVGLGLIIRGLTYRKDNEIAREVGEALARDLDGRYTFIRNLSRGGLGYIDALLIGPPGALVFRVSDDSGVFLNEGSDWLERKDGQNFALSRKNYTRECVTDIYALRDYLKKRNLGDVPVFGVVVLTSSQTQVSTRQPVVPVAELRTLMLVIRRDYIAQDRINAETIQKTVDAVFN